MLHHGAGNAHAVKGGGAAADLRPESQGFCGGIFQDSATSVISTIKVDCPAEVVRCADAGEDGIHNAHMTAGSGTKEPDLCHQRNQGILTHIGRFTRHVSGR